MLDGETELDPEDQETSKPSFIHLADKFRKENLIDEIKDALQEFASQGMSQRQVFEKLPTLGEFYIPASMNGRVIECSEASFRKRNQTLVVWAKAYSFDGHEIKYLFFDSADSTLQKGKFEEFPRDSFGRTMGHVGLQQDTLYWIKKNFEHV